MKDYFSNYRVEIGKLKEYGFNKEDSIYKYETTILNGDMTITISLLGDGKFDYKVIDNNINEPYDLIFVENVTGEYVGKAKQEFESIIEDIKEKCFERDTFKSEQTKQVIKYVREKYNGELEYLWSKFPQNAIWRHKENNQWYGALLVIPKLKIGLEDNTNIDIIDLKYPKEDIEKIIDNKNIFAGYHMNKEHWITRPLDNTMQIEDIYKYIDTSYQI